MAIKRYLSTLLWVVHDTKSQFNPFGCSPLYPVSQILFVSQDLYCWEYFKN